MNGAVKAEGIRNNEWFENSQKPIILSSSKIVKAELNQPNFSKSITDKHAIVTSLSPVSSVLHKV